MVTVLDRIRERVYSWVSRFFLVDPVVEAPMEMSNPDTPLHLYEQKRTLLREKMERLEFPEDEIRWLLAHVRPDSADELLELLTKWEGEMRR